MVAAMRAAGMPPIMLGMIRQATSGISEDELRNICARVGLSFIAIYAGASPEAALGAGMVSADVLDNLILILQRMSIDNALNSKQDSEADDDEEDNAETKDDEATDNESNPFTLPTS
jgi:hypothetical protein